MTSTPQDKTNLWTQILSRITSNKAVDSRQLSIFQIILVVSIVSVVIYATIYQLMYQVPPVDTIWHLIFLGGLYGLSRTRFYILSPVGFILMLLLQQFLILIPNLGLTNELSYVLTPVFALPIITLFWRDTTLRMGLWLCGGFIILSMTWWITQDGSVVPVQVGLLIIVMTMAMILLFPFIDTFVSDTIGSAHVIHSQMVEQSPDLMMLIDNEQIIYVNDAGLQMMGTDDSTGVIGKNLSDFIATNSAESSSSTYVTKTGKLNNPIVQSLETIKQVDGTTLSALVTVTPLTTESTRTMLLTAKPMHSAFSQTESLIDSASAMITVIQDNRNVYISNEFERLTGFAKEEVYAQDALQYKFIHNNDEARVRQWIANLYAGRVDNNTIEYRILRKSGDPVWVRSTASPIRYAGKPSLLLTIVDIDNYKSSALMMTKHIPYATALLKIERNDAIIVEVNQGLSQSRVLNNMVVGKSISTYIEGLPTQTQTLLEWTHDKTQTYHQQGKLYPSSHNPIAVEWTITGIEDNPLVDYLVTFRPRKYEEQLERDVKRYRAIFDMMNDYAFILRILPNDDYEFAWVSKAFQHITGYDPNAQVTKDLLKTLYHPDDLPIVDKHFRQLKNGEMAIHEYRIINNYGKVGWMREYAYPVRESDGTTLVYGSVRDITMNQNAEQSLQMYATQQAVIAEIGMVAIESTLDSHEFTLQALELIAQLLDTPWCVLVQQNPNKQNFEVYSMLGEAWKGEIESQANNRETYLRYVLQHQDTVVVNDWEKETRFKVPLSYKDVGIRSTLSVIVPMQHTTFGILNIHDTELRQFTAENINMVQMVANIIGTYIQQQKSQNDQREHYMMAQALIDTAAILNSTTELDEILRIILNFVSQLVPAVDASNIMLMDHERQVANIATRYNVNPDIPKAMEGQTIALQDVPLFVQMIETGQPIIISDVTTKDGWHVVPETSWIQSYLAAPIFADGECIGAVSLDSQQINAFTANDLEKIEAFLNHASIAIQNARQAERLTTEVQHRTQELRAERAQLQAFFDASGEGIFYSKERVMLYVNSQLCEMMGYTEEELLEQSSIMLRPKDLSEAELETRENIEAELMANRRSQAEIRFRRKDGTTFMGAITASTVGADGDTTFAATIIRDISEEKAIEAQKESFIAHAAHELRNPIASLNMRLYILRKKDNITAEDLLKVEQIVQKMNALVTGLLDLSRFESGRIPLQLQSVILQDILNDVYEIQTPEADQKQLNMSLKIPDDPIQILADDLRLYQVITNLVSNAIHYTPINGHIEIMADYVDDTERGVMIQVKDDGLGIPKDKQAELFQPFYRVDNEDTTSGTGLGLSICKQITEAHGGRIEVKSNVGEGACFTVYLPMSASDKLTD